ncbi:hypothetical protein [Nostoc sp. 'Peltigera membranacea cyanobiont' 232]|uniref:hypothetical protein n=1 Tax=Nostoc sp. 'Peltigera membranacea cyanobiont' 232 TaxID=2014531 RepID=UPI000B953246|nr:hypothetical protein [Nostoc sp. 'Peltigera membranacea cyanobiont' 232]OYE00372.1 hypothetical protein CDG79_35580 [Nostoc sp. 'Peltigera membranacea cyanobiont' 232]
MTVKKISFLGLLISFITCNPAMAQSIPVPSNQWQAVIQDTNGNIFQVDRGTVATNGNLTLYWVQILYSNGGIAVSRQYTAANCATNEYALGWALDANSQGQILTNAPVKLVKQYAASGTVSSYLINAVCTGFSTDPQLNALTRAQQTNAEAITRAMQIGAGMFK